QGTRKYKEDKRSLLKPNSSKRRHGLRHGMRDKLKQANASANQSTEQIKQDALAEKKAAEAKEKWAKTQENTKHKVTSLKEAKEDEEKARAAFQRAKAESDAVRR